MPLNPEATARRSPINPNIHQPHAIRYNRKNIGAIAMQCGLESLSDKHLYLANKQFRKEEFDHRCAYCGTKPIHLTIDHVVPRSQEGTNELNNLLPACRNCNESKGSRSLTNWYTNKNPRYTVERWNRIVEVLAIDQQQCA